MSVPYEKACVSTESPETPQEFLARLLSRTVNSFELSDELLARLNTALAHDSSLHSAHHSAGLHRITYRHTWLLADGSAVILWELAHNTAGRSAASPGPSGPATPGWAARQRPAPEGSQDGFRSPHGTPEPHAAQNPPGLPHEWRDRRWRYDQHELYTDEDQLRAAMERLPLPLDDSIGIDLPFTAPLPPMPMPMPMPRHVYAPDNSADHARRLLRRAENADRPDSATLQLLGTAAAHQITQAFGRPSPRTGARLGFSLYEHAFLLTDGREISLWEVEHTATPDGRHMCEVYTSEVAARRAMELRASQAN